MTDKEVEMRIAKRAAESAENTPETPELLYFSGAVKDAKRRIARRQNIQFAVFIAVAVLVAAGVMLCVFTSVALFAVLQLLPIALFFILYRSERRTEAPK